MQQIYEYHPSVGFRFIPNLKTRVPHDSGGYLVRANEQGFRCDRPFRAARTPGMRRVLLFGDSFTAGDGVSNGYRYGDVLEKAIPNLEVYNFGMPATGTDQHYLIYREFARDIEHDLLVIAVFVENIRRVAARYRHFLNDRGQLVLYAKPYFTFEHGELVLKGTPPPKLPVDEKALSVEERRFIFTRARYPRLKEIYTRLRANTVFERYVVQSGLKARAMRAFGYRPLTEYNNPNSVAWRVMRAIIHEWVSNHPRPVVLVPIPLYHYVAGLSDPTVYQQRLREAVEGAGGHYADPLPGLMTHSTDRRRSFFFHQSDGHLTRLGHEMVAQCLAPQIEALLHQ